MVMQGELVWYELPHLFWNTWQQIPHSWMCVYLYIKLFSSCNSIQKKCLTFSVAEEGWKQKQ